MTENLREIVTAYLVTSSKGGLILTTDKAKAYDVEKTARKNNIPIKIHTIVSNTDRVNTIGKNCIVREIPIQAKNNPIEFRNKLINEWHTYYSKLSEKAKVSSHITWAKIAVKYNITDCSYDEFSQWMLDYSEFIASHKEVK